MNYAQNTKNRDFIVSFHLDSRRFVDVNPDIYKPGMHETVDQEIFYRANPARIDIQASQFEQGSNAMTALPIEKRDTQPHLYKTLVSHDVTADHQDHLTYYKENADSGSFVGTIYRSAGEVEIHRTMHGGYVAAACVHGDLMRNKRGEFNLNIRSLTKPSWEIKQGMFSMQNELTKEARTYYKELKAHTDAQKNSAMIDKVMKKAESMENSGVEQLQFAE